MKSLFLILSLVILCSCRNSEKEAASFEAILESSTGQQHTLVKFYTKMGGYRVFKNEVTGEFTAYDLTNFNRKKIETYEAYIAMAGNSAVVRKLESQVEWVVEGHYYVEETTTYQCDANGENCANYTSYYTTNIWVDTSHYDTFYYGGGFRFSNVSTNSRDLETIAALEEEAALKMMSFTLSSQYSLSSARADELALLSFRYKKLENARELTESEKDMFAMKALGVSMNAVERSLKGDEQAYEELMKKAAQVNRTTPEQIGQFFEDYMF